MLNYVFSLAMCLYKKLNKFCRHASNCTSVRVHLYPKRILPQKRPRHGRRQNAHRLRARLGPSRPREEAPLPPPAHTAGRLSAAQAALQALGVRALRGGEGAVPLPSADAERGRLCVLHEHVPDDQ